MTAPAATPPDLRRISEQDADFQRARTRWQRRLTQSVRQLQRELAGPGGSEGASAAQSAFIHRHLALLRAAYLDGHREGQRDYWQEVSLTPAKWLRLHGVAPRERVIQRRLLFYGASSVVKLAREAEQVAAAQRARRSQTANATQSRYTMTRTQGAQASTLADPPVDLALDKFAAWTQPRIALQADLTWSGFQDGYLDAATADAAGLRLQLWWELGEVKTDHCGDCPPLAANSPYDPPGSGGNELTATPGDGATACGASCHCSLRYGWTQIAGLSVMPSGGGSGGSAAQDNELLLPPGETPLTPAPAVERPSAWERMRADMIARAQASGGNAASAAAANAPAEPPNPLSVAEQQRVAWERWLQELPTRPVEPPEAGGIGPLGASGAQVIDTTLVTGADGLPSITRNFVRVSPGGEPVPLAGLTDGQKAALDEIRSIALLWDAVRGTFPPFEVYFDPESGANLWGNPSLAGMDSAQRQIVERYFQALGDWVDNTPM